MRGRPAGRPGRKKAMSVAPYALAELLLGRALAWRLGRWLYTGSRRELQNQPSINGEYLLLRAWASAHASDTGHVTIVDVGANHADWTAAGLHELQSAGQRPIAWAFEPAVNQRAEISRRLGVYIEDGSLHLDARAVGAADGPARFLVTGKDTGSSSLMADGDTAGGIDVDVVRLDTVFANSPAMLDFVKVDTEGNDFNVIIGARNLFDAERIGILQFEYNWRWVAFRCFLKDVFDFIEGRPYHIGRLTKDGIEIYGSWHPELERFIETNYVLIHERIMFSVPYRSATFDQRNVVVSGSLNSAKR